MIASTQTNHPLTGVKEAAAGTPAPLEVACTRLKAASLRVTQPRLAILDVLIRHGRPLSIEAIHARLDSRTCDLVTVYRCMAAFEAIGLVRRAFLNNGTSLYEIRIGDSPRYHVVCKGTNKVEEIDPETTTALSEALRIVEESLKARGFTDVSHIVEFFGHSPAARRGEGAAPAVSPLVAPARNGG